MIVLDRCDFCQQPSPSVIPRRRSKHRMSQKLLTWMYAPATFRGLPNVMGEGATHAFYVVQCDMALHWPCTTTTNRPRRFCVAHAISLNSMDTTMSPNKAHAKHLAEPNASRIGHTPNLLNPLIQNSSSMRGVRNKHKVRHNKAM